MKRKYHTFFLIVLMSTYSNAIFSQLVSTKAALATAITNATAGSTITLADGIWTDTYINIKKTGTATNPINITAQTPGGVFLEGNSRVSMGGTYINLSGLIFRRPKNLTAGSSTISPVIEFQDSKSNSCSNCKVSNITIDSYNGTFEQATYVFKWIILYGQYNEISYSSFLGKYGVGSIINNNRNSNIPDYTLIHHNYFADRTFVGNYVDEYNDQDAIRIGNSSTSMSSSYSQVYDNLFNNWQGEIEIISNKSCDNKYYNNTFRDYSGSLTLRHGNNCDVYNNYFFANNQLFSGGIRVLGENHRIYNNYIEGVNSTKSAAAGGGTSTNLGGIDLIAGIITSVNGNNLSGYYQVKNPLIVNNTFVNNDFGIRLGGGSNTLPALNMIAANNVFLMPTSSSKAIDQILPADPTSPYIFTGNIKQSGTWVLTGNTTNNITVNSGLLTPTTEFYRIIAGSAAIGAAIGSYHFLTKDILGGIRKPLYDAGAEEFAAGGSKFPFKVTDVGVTIGFLGNNTILEVKDNSINSKGIIIYPNPTKGESITIISDKNIGNVSIYDTSGRLIINKEINNKKGQIEVSNLVNGVYVIKIQGGYRRFIVEN
ncbi:T9SS type A sorting domain-containing protein [Kaistella flava (ex Peng et al. 2021)]|uniref:T9SS type A sorting domain-containing protein n=1 Tax=Kaistella flava (ex Peng et al. 2021) TaxID=2038776 RepID=A0A7M2Y8J8_9FLAO|nr:polysaccharide lyase 6 family protein [Kaistella flava (ex Peng et al. 2021)]QOW10420.1 T9SS type A sorting domain-containing protein [Kaistella flava (ex Peng et al. 2021)]